MSFCLNQICVSKISFNEYAVKLAVGETKVITVSVKFVCTANLESSKARIWCAVKNENCSCDLLGIDATSELSSYISCDDISLSERLGGGTY